MACPPRFKVPVPARESVVLTVPPVLTPRTMPPFKFRVPLVTLMIAVATFGYVPAASIP